MYLVTNNVINDELEGSYDENITRHNLSTELNLWCSYIIRKMASRMTNSEEERKKEEESQDWHPQAPGWSRRVTYLTDEGVERKMLVMKEMESCTKQIAQRSTSRTKRKEADQVSGESAKKEDRNVPNKEMKDVSHNEPKKKEAKIDKSAAEVNSTAIVKRLNNSLATTSRKGIATISLVDKVPAVAVNGAGSVAAISGASPMAASTLVISTAAAGPPQGRNSIVKRVREENRARKARKEMEESLEIVSKSCVNGT